MWTRQAGGSPAVAVLPLRYRGATAVRPHRPRCAATAVSCRRRRACLRRCYHHPWRSRGARRPGSHQRACVSLRPFCYGRCCDQCTRDSSRVAAWAWMDPLRLSRLVVETLIWLFLLQMVEESAFLLLAEVAVGVTKHRGMQRRELTCAESKRKRASRVAATKLPGLVELKQRNSSWRQCKNKEVEDES